MRRVLLALLVGFTVSAFAQESDVNALMNKGNEAYKSKDYKAAYASYSEALKLMEAEGNADEALVYNTGYCAFKAKKYDEAAPYFEKSIEAGYKEAKPYAFLGQVYYKTGDIDKMEEVLVEGLEKYSDDKTLNKLMGIAYLKQGLKFYNQGNKIKKAANESGMNETDPEQFKAEYALADKEFEKALPYMKKAYEFDPKSKNAIKALQNIYINLDMQEEADKMKAALDAL